MELTRRDAAAALATLGVGGAAAMGGWKRRRDGVPGGDGEPRPEDGALPDDETVRETLVAVAEVVYPSEVTGIEPFVESFLAGRLDPDADVGGADRAGGDDYAEDDGRAGTNGHARGLRETVAELDRLAEAWHGARVVELEPGDRDRLLREVGADGVEEDPEGTTAARVRYYVVNELLLALYASPTGGELVGIENPQGYPGGTDTYQRGPPS